ncbi:unnamed protein product [Acanthoscelides obtectus]|uniref:Uncharacterized protein n=1 Tax=Acanthoscelides obtectus TaxID=200917 RepID=A0A9P0NUV5_ACAOB|nr:unnamed protein product [Acanthoscelides obtectus]CAK1642910.1 hypothetical protein AOBTE_LOCUS13286 [Acanthoscelides obtectus]
MELRRSVMGVIDGRDTVQRNGHDGCCLWCCYPEVYSADT